jgi:hypothetical protein
MLTIRREQMAAFDEMQRHQFALEMVAHLHRFAPTHAARLGDSTLYQLARRGLSQAEKHRLTLRGPVRLYIELMVLLGSHFDTDPQYPWAAAILDDRRVTDEMTRADRLQKQAVGFYDSVLGPDYEHERAAIQRLRENDLENLPERDDALRADLLARLGTIYPEKAQYVGRAALEALLAHAARVARACSLGTPSGVALFMAMMFAFGHGCDGDPQFPWIAQVLVETESHSPEQRVFRVRGSFLSFVRYGSPHKGA